MDWKNTPAGISLIFSLFVSILWVQFIPPLSPFFALFALFSEEKGRKSSPFRQKTPFSASFPFPSPPFRVQCTCKQQVHTLGTADPVLTPQRGLSRRSRKARISHGNSFCVLVFLVFLSSFREEACGNAGLFSFCQQRPAVPRRSSFLPELRTTKIVNRFRNLQLY